MNESTNRFHPEVSASSALVLPPTLDDQSVEQIQLAIAKRRPQAPLVMNARHCVFATPYALAALLAMGEGRGEKATFIPPADADTTAYWARARFFRYADELYDVRGKVPSVRWASESDVLLEMTRIPPEDAGGAIVQRVQGRILDLLVRGARMEADAAAEHAEAVAVACRTLAAGGGNSGWVMAQVVHYRKQAGLRGVLIGMAGPGAKGTSWKIDGPVSP
jgi:hypothetical protein